MHGLASYFFLHYKICTSEKRNFFRVFRMQEKIDNSLTHALTMKLYIPKYSELLTSYFSIVQLCPPNLMYSELQSKFPLWEVQCSYLAGIIEISQEIYLKKISTQFLASN